MLISAAPRRRPIGSCGLDRDAGYALPTAGSLYSRSVLIGDHAGPPPHALANEYFAGSAIECDYPDAVRELEPEWQRLACSLLFVGADGLPRGGRLALDTSAAGLVLTERHAAPESGVLAKAASGALDHLAMVRVVNLARAIEGLKQAGFWCLGLAAEGEMTLAEAKPSGRIALVLGAEGTGLRRLTREHCDQLLRLPTTGPVGQLNVSNAAAVALYELVRGQAPR